MDLANALFLLATLESQAGDRDGAAASTAQDCLAEQRELYPPGHAIPARTASLLGEIWTRLQRYDEAEVLLLDAHDDLNRTPGEDRNLELSRRRLVALYEATGRPELARPYRP